MRFTHRAQIEAFRKQVAATARAMTESPELEVQFVDSDVRYSRSDIYVPAPALQDDNAVTRVRGRTDAFALRLRYHDEQLHLQLAPRGQLKRAIFNAVEQIRCEYIGSTYLLGARKNLQFLMAERFRSAAEAALAGELHTNMSDVVVLLVYEVISDKPLPDYAASIVQPWRAHLTSHAVSLLSDLHKNRLDQYTFAQTLKRFIGVFGAINDDVPTEIDNRVTGNVPDGQQSLQGEQEESDSVNTINREDEQVSSLPSESVQIERSFDNVSINGAGSNQNRQYNNSTQQALFDRQYIRSADQRLYRAYTTEFDLVKPAQDLIKQDELSQLRRRLDNELPQLQGIIGRLANRLQRNLYAKQMREWVFDKEEGLLDCSRLPRLVTKPYQSLSFKEEIEGEFKDTVVTLLIDNSGSMAGRKITVAAICSDILASTLERCGVKTEILGFTTNSWKGGRVWQSWLSEGKQPHPGRLNELLHIVYKSAETPWRRARQNLGLMLRTSILKENIDGEALLWAHGRLVNKIEDRRILIVISDGAPVDDATLSANGHGYLDAHLHQVINHIEDWSPVELFAIGIGHEVGVFYRHAVTISDVDTLGHTIFSKINQLFES